MNKDTAVSDKKRLKRKPRPLPHAIQQWAFLKAMAYFEGAWQRCGHRECRARKRCTGGPRGSFARNRREAVGTRQEARSATGATGTKQMPGSEATGKWISVPLCRLHAPAEWWAEVEKFGK